MDENELKAMLFAENAEFRRLHQEHQRYENLLADFKNKPYLSDQEHVEEKELKKKKLALKDEMYRLMKDVPKPV